MNEERIKEIFSDEEFVKELLSRETPEEAQELLAEKDIDVSIEELVKLKDLIIAKLQAAESGESAELTEDDLADVAGGTIIPTLVFFGFFAFVATNIALVANGHELRW